MCAAYRNTNLNLIVIFDKYYTVHILFPKEGLEEAGACSLTTFFGDGANWKGMETAGWWQESSLIRNEDVNDARRKVTRGGPRISRGGKWAGKLCSLTETLQVEISYNSTGDFSMLNREINLMNRRGKNGIWSCFWNNSRLLIAGFNPFNPVL